MTSKERIAKRLREGCVPAYRGIKPRGSHGYATNVGNYGAGLYYTTARDIARYYANHDDRQVVERCVHFKRPYVLGVAQAQRMALHFGTMQRTAGGI